MDTGFQDSALRDQRGRSGSANKEAGWGVKLSRLPLPTWAEVDRSLFELHPPAGLVGLGSQRLHVRPGDSNGSPVRVGG